MLSSLLRSTTGRYSIQGISSVAEADYEEEKPHRPARRLNHHHFLLLPIVVPFLLFFTSCRTPLSSPTSSFAPSSSRSPSLPLAALLRSSGSSATKTAVAATNPLLLRFFAAKGAVRGRLGRRKVRRPRDRDLGAGKPVLGAIPYGTGSGCICSIAGTATLASGLAVRVTGSACRDAPTAVATLGISRPASSMASAATISGSWHEGKEQGFGLYTFRSGKTRSGDWDCGGALKNSLVPSDPAVQKAVQRKLLLSQGVDEQVNKAINRCK